MMKLWATLLVALLLAAQGCSAARMPLSFVDKVEKEEPATPTTPIVSSSAKAKAVGTTGASASAGSAADGATKTTVAGALGSATGTTAATSAETSGNSGTGSGRVKTSGLATGADGAASTSIAQTITTPNTATAVGFSTGSAFGEGASYTAATDVAATTPFGSATGKSTVLASSDLGLYASAVGEALSGAGGLFSRSQSVGITLDGSVGRAISTATSSGGYATDSGDTTAETTVSPLEVTATGTADATGAAVTGQVILQEFVADVPEDRRR